MGVHAYRFPIRSSPVHTYNRLCFKTTIFTRTGLKAFQNSPSLPLKSKFGRQTCLFKYFYVMVYLKPSQVLSDFGTMLSRSTELGLFGFKSRHNNKLKHLTLRTYKVGCETFLSVPRSDTVTSSNFRLSQSAREQGKQCPRDSQSSAIFPLVESVFEKQFRILVDAPW